jgi:hypothetical protein
MYNFEDTQRYLVISTKTMIIQAEENSAIIYLSFLSTSNIIAEAVKR